MGRRVPAEADELRGFRRGKIRLGRGLFPIIHAEGVQASGQEPGRGQETADARPQPSGAPTGPASVVKGFVITVTTEELRRLDAYETSAYRRSEVTLASGRKAWVYHA